MWKQERCYAATENCRSGLHQKSHAGNLMGQQREFRRLLISIWNPAVRCPLDSEARPGSIRVTLSSALEGAFPIGVSGVPSRFQPTLLTTYPAIQICSGRTAMWSRERLTAKTQRIEHLNGPLVGGRKPTFSPHRAGQPAIACSECDMPHHDQFAIQRVRGIPGLPFRRYRTPPGKMWSACSALA